MAKKIKQMKKAELRQFVEELPSREFLDRWFSGIAANLFQLKDQIQHLDAWQVRILALVNEVALYEPRVMALLKEAKQLVQSAHLSSKKKRTS